MSDSAYGILERVMSGNVSHLDAVSLLNSEYNKGNLTDDERNKLTMEIEEWYKSRPTSALKTSFEKNKVRKSSGGGGR